MSNLRIASRALQDAYGIQAVLVPQRPAALADNDSDDGASMTTDEQSDGDIAESLWDSDSTSSSDTWPMDED